MYVFVVLVGGSCIYFGVFGNCGFRKRLPPNANITISCMNTIKFASMIVRKVSRFPNMFIGIFVPDIKA